MHKTVDLEGKKKLPLYSKESCSLKNSLNAGSEGRSCSVFGVETESFGDGTTEARLLCPEVVFWERHICARRPSICRRPFRSLELSFEETLSKARERSVSILFVGRRGKALSLHLILREKFFGDN